MARLSREKKRDQKQAAHAADRAAVPIDVHVPLAGVGAGAATVAGIPVAPAPGEEVQQAVLNRLHRMAVASGRAVLATVHDERIGYVVPLRVAPDGSSRFTAEPVRTGPARPGHDRPTHVLRPVPEPRPAGGSAPTFPLRAVPEPARDTPPGTVAPPTGEFGPPPPMNPSPHPVPGAAGPANAPEAARTSDVAAPASAPGAAGRAAVPGTAPAPIPEPHFAPARTSRPGTTRGPVLDDPELPADARPTPPRGFDAVAEAVLGDEPLTAPGDDAAPALLAEPVAQINDAVRAGRIDAAARLAEQTVAEASGTLGAEHPEVLRLHELNSYIAYLAGEPLQAFRLSLDLAGIHRRVGDAEAAYGNVRSAATAWRAVRDPQLGLELGRELIGLWTELTAEDGPAADEIEELESARARMGRLTARARAQRA
ncbi:tetratricopeptide repeat protein [Streptomyces sp. NPDC005931]|uniref:tetratricopeptide repeat protein n=1 Tax=Streptomyces sp. NPDC005931 TaxID=3364737 RepID=UPI0036A59E4D